MKRILSLAALAAFALTLTLINTQDTYAQGKPADKGFVDVDGDGYNDNAMDEDGDGIPNGQDEDYTGTVSGRGFVDVDGDGVNDNAPDADGDGIPNGQDEDYVPAGDGSQAGKALRGGSGDGEGTGTGTGDCDGTGPKGNARRGK